MKHWLEYIAYRTLAFVVPFMPRRMMVYVGRRLGGFYYLIHSKARGVGMENLKFALPERNDHRKILRESLRLQGVALLDALWSARLTPQQAAKYVDFTVMHESGDIRYAGEGTGWVMATAHYGSWEMFNLAGGATKFPATTIIARSIRNKRIDAHLRRRRERTGNKMVYRARAVPACLAALRRGEATCSVIDVAVLPREGAVFVDFFGMPAATSGDEGCGLGRHVATGLSDPGDLHAVLGGRSAPGSIRPSILSTEAPGSKCTESPERSHASSPSRSYSCTWDGALPKASRMSCSPIRTRSPSGWRPPRATSARRLHAPCRRPQCRAWRWPAR